MNHRMKNIISMKNLWRCLLPALLALLSQPGWAVISGSAQPASTTIPLNQPTTMTVTWIVTESSAPSQNFTISSSSGLFLVPATGQVLGTVNTVVSKVVTGPVGLPATAIITEVVAVPQEVSVLAIRAGVSTISYQRTFADSPLSLGMITANIMIGGSGSAPFAISRMALTFDDGAVVRIVPPKSRLSATADVSYNGTGMFTGYWEAADPGTTSGTPIFIQLQPVAQGFGGTGRVKLTSQYLPTEIPGLHIVRLRATEPLPSFDPPVLYYYVGEPKPGTTLAFMPITVMNPPSRAYVDAATQFVWQPVTGARAYKIEIFASPAPPASNLPELGGDTTEEDPLLIRNALSRPPVAGMLVTGKQSQMTLSALTRSKLQPQHAYFWRIQAIGEDGTVVGEAQVRELRIP